MSFFLHWKRSQIPKWMGAIRMRVQTADKKHYRLTFWPEATLIMDLFLINMQFFTSQDINWWTEVVWITCALLWCFYQLFGHSFWRHPFTAEDPLVSKRFNDKFLQIYSSEETKSSTSWMVWLYFQHIFISVWTVPLSHWHTGCLLFLR